MDSEFFDYMEEGVANYESDTEEEEDDGERNNDTPSLLPQPTSTQRTSFPSLVDGPTALLALTQDAETELKIDQKILSGQALP